MARACCVWCSCGSLVVQVVVFSGVGYCVLLLLCSGAGSCWFLAFDHAHGLKIYKSTATQPVIDNSEILIPGIFLDSDSLKYGIWSIIGHQDVNPEEVEFPEALISHGLRAQFLRGEVALNIDLKEEELKKINVRKTKKPSGILGEICLYQLGRADEITNSWVHSIEVFNLNSSDLRFSQHRSEIYRLLGEKENQSYFEMSSRLGYNIQRFYDKKNSATITKNSAMRVR